MQCIYYLNNSCTYLKKYRTAHVIRISRNIWAKPAILKSLLVLIKTPACIKNRTDSSWTTEGSREIIKKKSKWALVMNWFYSVLVLEFIEKYEPAKRRNLIAALCQATRLSGTPSAGAALPMTVKTDWAYNCFSNTSEPIYAPKRLQRTRTSLDFRGDGIWQMHNSTFDAP